METTLKGKLEYTSLFNPIRLFTDTGEVDLRDYIWKFFQAMNGKKASNKETRTEICIQANEESASAIEYKNENGTILMLLRGIDTIGFSNLGAYLPDKLQQINGRQVIFTASDSILKISADPEEKVHGLYYTGEGNSCALPDDELRKSLCKPGQGKDCCIFLSLSNEGYECEKFNSSITRIMLDRFAKKETNAGRIGNCEVLGRIPYNHNWCVEYDVSLFGELVLLCNPNWMSQPIPTGKFKYFGIKDGKVHFADEPFGRFDNKLKDGVLTNYDLIGADTFRQMIKNEEASKKYNPKKPA